MNQNKICLPEDFEIDCANCNKKYKRIIEEIRKAERERLKKEIERLKFVHFVCINSDEVTYNNAFIREMDALLEDKK